MYSNKKSVSLFRVTTHSGLETRFHDVTKEFNIFHYSPFVKGRGLGLLRPPLQSPPARDPWQKGFFIGTMSDVTHVFTGVFIPANIWLSRELIPSEKMLLGEIDALSKTSGWCYASRKHFAEWLQCGLPNVSYYIDKLQKLGFLEVERKAGERSKMRIVTARFYEKQVVSGTDGVVSGTDGVVSGTDGVVSGTDPKYKLNTSNNQNIREEITPLSENGKTEVTLHSPDQVGNTFLHVVENGSLEAEHDKDYSGAGPGEETPALKNAGTLKAECFSNNPPPIFFNPELQRRYNGTTPTNGKARKSPAQDRTAQICAELKTPEVLDFFHAIADAWGEWTDYKRREKKGAYKTAKTEAATIAALAKTVNYDSAAGRAAIEHSIAHTYQGIYPSKDAKPTAEHCARYSMQDSPRATTPEEMTVEISRFYNANKDKYQSLLRHPGMDRYTVPKLKEAVSLFCASRIKQNRGGETFQQQHAALEQHFLFLIKREREDAAKQGGQTYNPADVRKQAKF